MPRHPIEHAILSAAQYSAPWLICVSGGADSMAMLHACRRAGVAGVAAHCNFHLRGEESMRDEAFVRQTCAALGVTLHVTDFDTDTYCSQRKLSLEMGCRELRYEWFRRLAKECGLQRIAVAHNADDDTETMLLNLLRGTGIRGLTGMKGDNGEIIRPLLPFSRAEIQDYLDSIGAEWITDSSNLASDFKRNFLRNEILPALRSRWPGLDKTLARTRTHLCDSALLADSALARALGSCPEHLLPHEALKESPAPAALIHAWLGRRSASPTQISDMASAAPGAQWNLPEGTVTKSARGLTFSPPGFDSPLASARIVVEKLTNSEETRLSLRADRSQSAFYCAPPARGLHLRPPHPGERFSPMGLRGSTTVAKVLKEAGVPPAERGSFLLLADSADRPLWLPGIKRSSLLPVTPLSPFILRITLRHEQ